MVMEYSCQSNEEVGRGGDKSVGDQVRTPRTAAIRQEGRDQNNNEGEKVRWCGETLRS